MKTNGNQKKTYSLIPCYVFLLFFCFPVLVFGVHVDEEEARSIATMWHIRELNSAHLKLDKKTIQSRIRATSETETFYLDKNGDLLETMQNNTVVHAYIFTFKPSGFVIVSAHDEILPIVAFDALTTFRWDNPNENFLRSFAKQNMRDRWQNMEQYRVRRSATTGNIKQQTQVARSTSTDTTTASDERVHPMWRQLREMSVEAEPKDNSPQDGPETTTWLLETATWGQDWPYNTTVVSHVGNNQIPVGCTATAMAIKMRYHSWPPSGSGSASYIDSVNGVNYSHSVDFSSYNYDWGAMPTTHLTFLNQFVADLMYHIGVSVKMDYSTEGSGAWMTLEAMNSNFSYKGTIEQYASHETHMRTSILAELPVVLSTLAHTVVADGYRDDFSPYFHINAGWRGYSNAWYNLNSIPGGDNPTESTVFVSYPYSSPSNYIYTDYSWTGTESGDLQNPYNTLMEGYTATPTNGHLWIRSGTYNVTENNPVTFDKAVKIHSYDGDAIIR